jgi:DNA modification methylase
VTTLSPSAIGGSAQEGQETVVPSRQGDGMTALPVEPKPDQPYAQGTSGESWWTLYDGDCIDVLRKLPRASVDCVVTSPPYFWQRDYSVEGQFGMEPTIEGFVENLRATFREIWSVLKPDGTILLNLGDTYYNKKGKPHGHDTKNPGRRMATLRAVDTSGLGLPRKSLIGIPWRVALALQDDGWTLRSDIIWVRNQALGEPTSRDRPWRRYEHVFLLSKSIQYHFDRDKLDGEEDVWHIDNDQRGSTALGFHFAQFPRGLARRCIAVGSRPGDVVLDPFVGGGTSMSVALAMGRHAIGIDLNRDYCDHVVKVLDTENALFPAPEQQAG